MRTYGMGALAAGVCMVALAVPAQAQAQAYNIPAGSLRSALDAFGRQSGKPIIYKVDEVQGFRSRGFHGTAVPQVALDAILASTGFAARIDGSGAVAIVKGGNGGSDSASSSGGMAAAADSASQADEVEMLPEIVVTANKYSQRLIDVPASITAETGEQLRQRGAVQLQDIVATTPGLSNPGPGGGNGSNLVIRGVTTDTAQSLKQSTVSVMFDDIPVDPSTSGLEATNLRIVDIERVEVLRGPQGTLFGSGSLSGAVRYITNKPDATAISGSIEGTIAGTKTGADSKWGNAVLNLPLVTDRVALRAVGYIFDEGGWVDNIHSNQKNVNRNKTYGGRIALSAQATDQLSVTLTGAYQNSRDYAGGESLYFQPAGANKQVSTTVDSGDSRVKSTIANLGLTYDFGAVSLFSSSTYIHRDVDFFQGRDYYAQLVDLAVVPLFGNLTAPGNTFNSSHILQQEVRLASNGNGPFRWTLGGFYLRSKTPTGGQTIDVLGLQPYVDLSIFDSTSVINVSAPGKQEEIAGFGQATYTIGDMLDLTAGLRVSNTKINITTTASGLLITGGTNTITSPAMASSETTVNPRFSILYHPTRQLSVYVQAARGYRVGGVNLTAVFSPGTPLTYKSDNLWNYEAGVKTNLLDGRLQINADVYYIDWKKLQVSLTENGLSYVGNAGAARVYGFEAEVAAKPTSWLDLGGTLSLSNAALTEDTPTLVRTTGVVGVKDGDRLPGSPQTQGSAYAQLNFGLGEDTAYVRASGQYVGASYTDFDSKGIRFGDYTTVDLRAGIVHNNLEATIFVRNLLDSEGKKSAAAQSLLQGIIVSNAQRAWRVRPRTIGLTGRISF